MSKIAVFPGSFDPVTIGHLEIILRAVPLFDKLILAIGHNSSKKALFSLNKRQEWLEQLFSNNPNVEVQHYKGLTMDFCKLQGAGYIVRGLRTAADFSYERTIAQLNREMDEGLDTIFLTSSPQYAHISSTVVREILLNNGDASKFLPESIAADVAKSL